MDGLGLPAGMRVVALGALLAKRTFRPSGPKCENRTRRPGRLPECPGAVPRAPGAWKTLRRAPASLRRRGTLVRISQLPGSGHTLARISAAAGKAVPSQEGGSCIAATGVAAATSLRDISPARAPARLPTEQDAPHALVASRRVQPAAVLVARKKPKFLTKSGVATL
ncbi:hypothetical protein PG995_012441 [Apiospora arundinis]